MANPGCHFDKNGKRETQRSVGIKFACWHLLGGGHFLLLIDIGEPRPLWVVPYL